MRSYVILPALSLVAVGMLACDSGTLSGPEAQRAYAQAAQDAPVIPAGTLVLVNDERVPRGRRLDLDPKHIARIEILKGAAAAELYGNEARLGVVRIYTIQASGSGVATKR